VTSPISTPLSLHQKGVVPHFVFLWQERSYIHSQTWLPTLLMQGFLFAKAVSASIQISSLVCSTHLAGRDLLQLRAIGFSRGVTLSA
jgi:hypothetical protein